MDIKKIKELTDCWFDLEDEVLQFNEIELEKVKKLFKETYGVLMFYREDSLVPKEISDLLLNMMSCAKWVSEVEDSPLHSSYQTILSLAFDISSSFLYNWNKNDEINYYLEELVAGE